MTGLEKEYAHITQFIGSIKSGTVTESLIGLVADTTGMLGTCRTFVESLDAGDGDRQAWLQQECKRVGVEPRLIIEQMRIIVELFGSGDNDSDPYEILGLSRGASGDAIKRAYRALSLKYHPDTSSEGSGSEETFIRVSRAYQQLTDKSNGTSKPDASEPVSHWRTEKERTISDSQRNRGVVITVGLVIVLLVVSMIAAMDFRKRTMLSSLEHSRGAFVPPAESTIKDDLKSPYRSPNRQENDRRQFVATKSSGRGEEDHKNFISTDNQTSADENPQEDLNAVITPPEPQEKTVPEAPDQQIERPKDATEKLEFSGPTEKLDENDIADIEKNLNVPKGQQKQLTQPESIDKYVGKSVEQKSPIPKPTVVRPQAQPLKKKVATLERTQSDLESDKVADSEPATKLAKAKQATAIAAPLVESPAPIPTQPELLSKNNTTSPILQTDIKPLNQAEQHERVGISSAESPVLLEPSSEDLDIQARVQSFIEEYVEVYEKGDIIQFSQLFIKDAIENGKPFVKRHSLYDKWFKKTKNASLDIQILHTEAIDELIVADGRFTLQRVLKNGKSLEQGGQISFELMGHESRLLVKSLSYDFEQKMSPKSHTDTFLSEATVEPLSEQERHKQAKSGLKGPPAPIDSPALNPGLQASVQSFVDQYTAAYEAGNIILFSQFFTLDAVENAKPFKNRLSVYSKQFDNTQSASFKIEVIHTEMDGELILVEGGFNLSINYKSGRHFEGAGDISFVLIDNDQDLRIQDISYKYHK